MSDLRLGFRVGVRWRSVIWVHERLAVKLLTFTNHFVIILMDRVLILILERGELRFLS